MFLALAFTLFLAAPLVLLAGSVGRTAVAVSRGEDITAAAEAEAKKAGKPMPAPVLEVEAPRNRGIRMARTRPAVAGGNRRDYFGDTVVAGRPVTAPAKPVVSKPIGAATTGTLLPFRTRETYDLPERSSVSAGA